MNDREKLIELMKEVKFPPLPGGGLDVSVANQFPDHAFDAIADHLIANGVTTSVCCKECEFAEKAYTPQMQKTYVRCGLDHGKMRRKDFFCADGKRKEQTK